MPLSHTGIDYDSYSFNCVCGLPENHPLLEYERLTPRELDNEPFVSLGSDHMTCQQTRQAFADAGAKWRARVEAQLFSPAARLTQQGCGISMLDPITAAEFSDRGVVSRPFSPNIEYTIGILYPAEHPRSLLTEEFSALIKKRLEEFRLTTG